MNHKTRFWLTYLPLVTLWALVTSSHHYNFWWFCLGALVLSMFSSVVAD
jgi:hypothetical protein